MELTERRASRYRVEDGFHCIDVRVGTVDELFDNRDPAPFLGRDLDPALVEYLRDSAEDLLGKDSLRVVFWLEIPCAPGKIEAAFEAHFVFALEQIRRRRRRQRRAGELALFIALLLLAGFQYMARLIPEALPGSLGISLRQGLVIMSWVLVWRPLEVLFYDWIPVRHERRIVRSLSSASIHVRNGKGPDAPPFTVEPAG